MDNLTPITREEMLMNDEPLTPITREEKILAGEDLECVTRREYFLKKYRHTGGDVMVEGLEVTANGTYTAPEGKAYSPVEVAVPLPDNAYLLKTASGSLVSFNDGADLPMPSFVCNIDAVQDLHGYDAPWVGGAGKNKYNATKITETADGITITRNEFGEYTVTGTATALHQFSLGTTTIKAGDYILNGCPSGGGTSTYDIRFTNNAIDNGSGATLHLDSDVSNSISITVRKGYSFPSGGLVFKPMIRLATETDPTFAPYSNICPISGHTGVDAWVRGKNLVNWKWNAFNNDKMEIFLKGGTYTLSAESTLSDGKGYIRGTKPSGEYVSREELGLISWSATTTSGLYYGGSAQQQTYTFNVPNGGAKIEFGKINNNGTISAQLESGSTASTYTPYNPNSQTIQVSWQTEAGEVYGGYVDLVSGVLTVTHKVSIYDGSENWILHNSNRFYLESLPTGLNTAEKATSISNKGIYRDTPLGDIGSYFTFGSSGIYINKTNEEQTLEDFTQSLGTTNYQVKYPLATPITYQLTPTQIKSLLGNNNAWCDTGDVTSEYFGKEVTG